LSARRAVRLALWALAAAATAFALGPPRSTWENEGLRVRHPPGQVAAAVLGAAALAAAAVPPRPRAFAVLAVGAALGLAGLAAHRLAWRVEAVQSGLHERTLAGWTRIAWQDVESVDSRGASVVVRSRDGRAVALAGRGLGAEDRTRLERTIARRLREASGANGLR
jgi:hypothetical protein